MDEKLFDAAYHLVRTVVPGVSAEQWLLHARKVRMRGGLLALIGAENTLFGLLTYRNEDSLRHGRIFHVDDFMTFELNRAAPGRMALCGAAEALARKQGCTAIEFRLDSGGYLNGSTAKSQGWLDLGHSLDAVVFSKAIGAVDAEAAFPVASASTV